MLKRTIFITQPQHLSVKDHQLLAESRESGEVRKVPVEDLGFLVIENQQVSLTPPLLNELNENNVAVVFCDQQHLPSSMLLNLDGHHLQGELFRKQTGASEPLKKNLWKQVVEQKIRNQAGLLRIRKEEYRDLLTLAANVKSGDSSNQEGTAARLYWKRLIGESFIRDRYGAPPNSMLNYGYTILRAAVARALAGSGLLATLGIHHHNRYNAFALADDIMEPYRPFVDRVVCDLNLKHPGQRELTTEIKAALLEVLSADTRFGKNLRPLMVGLSSTTASLARCFSGEQRSIEYPLLQ
ncbi:MAG: type II CRISPR-associated endonuclease Cas1 [Bacteroidota bacterium]